MNRMGSYFVLIVVCIVLLESVHCTGSSSFKRQTKEISLNRHAVRDANVKTVHTRTAEEGELRLAGGATALGRLEIYHDGSWGTVCDDGFSNEAALVACTSMGFTGGLMTTDRNSNYDDEGPIWLDDVYCQGDEANLLACRHNPIGEHNCGHSEDVFIDCFTRPELSTEGEEGAVRLVGTSKETQGRVEIYHDGEWGTICDDDFEDTAATVVCKSLGYFGGTEHPMAHYGQGSGSIWLDDVVCSGEESSILDCSHRPWGDNNCKHLEDVGVECAREHAEGDGQIQLVGGPDESTGRVEIYYGGQWGTVCDDYFDDNNKSATVVCRTLGYQSGRVLSYGAYGPGEGTILLDDVKCSGEESDIMECSHNPPMEHNCSHSEDVGVTCGTCKSQ